MTEATGMVRAETRYHVHHPGESNHLNLRKDITANPSLRHVQFHAIQLKTRLQDAK